MENEYALAPIAFVVVAALMMGIAYFVPDYSSWNWTFALMFGALISATDPVAVVALLKELNTSKRFSTLVDAESLLNDGTGIVLFMLFFGAFSGPSPVFASPLTESSLKRMPRCWRGTLTSVPEGCNL